MERCRDINTSLDLSSWCFTPVQRLAAVSRFIERSNPGNVIVDKLGRKSVFLAPARAGALVARAVAKELPGQFRARPAPINKIVAEQNAVDPSIRFDIERIRAPVV